MFKKRIHSEKVKNKEMPQSLEVSKDHKVMIIKCLKLVILCVFVPLWLNYNFRSWFKQVFFFFILFWS